MRTARLGNCGNLTHGHLEPGLQTGYCCDTGGGWATQMVAHPSQIHVVPDELDDRAAVLIEPTACAVHAALAAQVSARRDRRRHRCRHTRSADDRGPHTVVAARAASSWRPSTLTNAVGPPSWPLRMLRWCAATPDEITRAVRRTIGTAVVDPAGAHERLTQGADVTIDCVGSAESLTDALAVTRPGGRVVLVGMPGVETLDLTPLWQREISLTGAYAYGTETVAGARCRTFDLAAELVAAADLGRLVSATYALERYADALEHAGGAGRLGATKIAFCLPAAGADPDHPASRTLKGRR